MTTGGGGGGGDPVGSREIVESCPFHVKRTCATGNQRGLAQRNSVSVRGPNRLGNRHDGRSDLDPQYICSGARPKCRFPIAGL